MELTLGTANCSVCRKRPLALGGNNLCPVLKTLYPLRKDRDSHDCTNFQLGDAKKKKPKPEQDGLF